MHSQNENGLQFLFDIHGTGRTEVKGHPIDIIIGTDQGRSIHALTEIDPGAFWSDKGLINLLKSKNKKYGLLIQLKSLTVAFWTVDIL